MMAVEGMKDEVRSWMRSGTLMFDMARVVEELVLNSLDAGASQVRVYVNVGACFVKVEDDGFGISRDGLQLLGQRYVTSKKPDHGDTSFGSRGEALASIADVSLIEVITRTSGRPNGFRKLLKGSKCLYFGIENDCKIVGTTVIVRDMFYNQPVRRKYLQSSPKKVTQSVKKCVFQISLVHKKTVFKVVDCDSEEQLLDTSSFSPLRLLLHDFGISDPNFLYPLNYGNSLLKIYGYISNPCHNLYAKAFQYVYINSRCICKGKIHRLLNDLSTSANCYNEMKADNITQKGKRNRTPSNLSFIVNLSCPVSYYDLMFEPSKTTVHFKDWVTILKFIEEAFEQTRRATPNRVEKLRAPSLQADSVSLQLSESYTKSPNHCFDENHETLAAQGFEMQYFNSKDKLDLIHPDVINSLCYDPSSSLECINSEDIEWNCMPLHENAFNHSCVSKNYITVTRKRQLDEDDLGLTRLLSVSKVGLAPIYGMPESDFGNSKTGFFLHGCSLRSRLPFDNVVSPCPKGYEFMVDGFKAKRQRHSCSYEEEFPTDSYDNIHTMTCWNDKSSSGIESKPRSLEELNLLDEKITEAKKLPWDARYDDIVATTSNSSYEWLEGCSSRDTLSRNISQGCCPNMLLDSSNYDPLDFRISKSLGMCNDLLNYPSSNSCIRVNDTVVDLESDYSQVEDATLGKGNDKHFLHFKPNLESMTKITRRYSAPPFCTHKKKYISLPLLVVAKSEVVVPELPSDASVPSEIEFFQHSEIFSDHVTDSLNHMRSNKKVGDTKDILDMKINKGVAPNSHQKEFITEGWQSCSIPKEYSFSVETEEVSILDATSGTWYVDDRLLVPGPSTKYLLEDAKVLQQVDKKFIPIIGGGILSLVDQHAADERIRLEQFHDKVLRGQLRTVTYLDVEQELVLPEYESQLLLDYEDKIRSWGWICNIETRGSETFKRSLNILHRQAASFSLVAVPNILGVNLTDEDLVEFLQQLADTDGSSCVPPSVYRILNTKACRGAIMFGDSLLQSECALIIEELKQTSLCFQCAHGRPTTVSLVSLEALHERIGKLAVGGQPWNGLMRHHPSLERAHHRLDVARR